MKDLSTFSIQYLKGVGPARKKLFANLGVETIEDLFYFFPRRYEDRRHLTKIAKVKVGEWHSIVGTLIQGAGRRSWYTHKHVTEVMIDDKSGRIFCIWFNQPYLEKYLRTGQKIICYGKVDIYKNRLQMVSPEYEILEDDEEESLSLNRIVPVYSLTRGMSQRYLRKTIKACLDLYGNDLKDELPVTLRNKHRLSNIKRSINNIHFPEDFKDQEEALKRICFEEFYFFQTSIILRRLSIVQKKGISHKINDTLALQFVSSFPFELTTAQKKVIREIRSDMEKQFPMLRLLQGDVGSGKTLVALFGCIASYQNGCQSAIMAPTEILARQHYEKIRHILEKTTWAKLKICLLTSSLKPQEKDEILKDIKEGKVDLIIGTHALINEEVVFKRLSFIVIDEQHKFGVRQRALLTEKGSNPDVLIMTATPIPRTLSITLYGDLDASIIDELPKGRGQIKTFLYSPEQSLEVYQKVKEKLKAGQQAYIVYPLIEESEKLDLKAAQAMYKQFKDKDFKDFKVALLHGQMKKKDSDEIMDKFKEGKIDVLVATTVLEVGVDVPNASVMVIEHAERFGLSQLHQLRGRIGRGQHDSICILVGEPTTQDAQKRLEAILSTTDGFKIAEADLLIRGPGMFFDRHQHGLNELKVANPLTQIDILELARKEAMELTQLDPELSDAAHKHIKELIKKRYPNYLKDVKAG